MEKINWERLAAMVICVAAGGILLVIGLRWILPILLPFLLGWAIAACLRPLAARLSTLLHLPRGLCAVFLLLVTLIALIWLTGTAINRLLRELQGFLSRMIDGGLFSAETVSFDLFGLLGDRLGISLPLEDLGHSRLREQLNGMILEAIKGAVSSVSAELPRAAARMISAMPSVLLFTAITVIAGFYFCLDRGALTAGVTSVLPAGIRSKLPHWKARIKQFSWKYVRAYLLLLLFTLAALFLGFLLLGVEYPFLIALVTAAVDLLPVLGVGAVLVPWAAIELLQRNLTLGIGLLLLYLAVSILRQILEPRLVGRSIGLHPLLTLVAGYAGFRLLGVLGLLLGPILAALLKSLLTGRKT